MRQIKFRGRDIETDRTVYGGYEVGRCGEPIIITNLTAAYEVTPESVAQLIGIDADGSEIYEGDLVMRVAPSPDWDEYTQRTFDTAKAFPMRATFEDYRAIRDEEIILVVKDNGRADKNSGGRVA